MLVDPALVKVVAEADASTSVQKLASEKKKQTPAMESSKKKSKTASTSDDIKALDAKWSKRFLRLEAMFMARSLQPPGGQSTFNMYQCQSQLCSHWLVV